jgi:hypothetical protein
MLEWNLSMLEWNLSMLEWNLSMLKWNLSSDTQQSFYSIHAHFVAFMQRRHSAGRQMHDVQKCSIHDIVQPA